MKVKTPSLLKKIMAALSSKTNDLKIRIMIFFLLHKNNLDKTTLTHKLHALVAHHPQHLKKKNDDVFGDSQQTERLLFEDEEEEEDKSKSKSSLLMYYNKSEGGEPHAPRVVEEEEKEENLTHALFKESEAAMEEEEEAAGGGGAGGGRGVVVDLAEVEEEDIDKAAGLFIERFRRQIQLQKLHSLDSHQQRLLHANA